MAARSTPPMADSTDVREWIRHAESDLRLAETAPPSGVILEHLCFHAQQAAEKAIKAVLIAGGVAPPKVHDIGRLLDLVASRGIDVPESVEEAARLTPFAVISRYPADFGEVDEAEWAEAVALARAAVAWAEREVA